MKNTKKIGLMLLIVAMLSVLSPVLAPASPSQPLTVQQMQQASGGLPVLNIAACTALLAACLDRLGSWWGEMLCIGLVAACLAWS